MSDFELTMQEPPHRNERLSDLSDLAGETILAIFDTCDTRDGEVVIVTDTFNWLVLDAEADGCGEDPQVFTKRFFGRSEEKTLVYYVTPRKLLDAGCINASVYAELQATEDKKDKAEKERKAAYLRAQLAKLESGAA